MRIQNKLALWSSPYKEMSRVWWTQSRWTPHAHLVMLSLAFMIELNVIWSPKPEAVDSGYSDSESFSRLLCLERSDDDLIERAHTLRDKLDPSRSASVQTTTQTSRPILSQSTVRRSTHGAFKFKSVMYILSLSKLQYGSYCTLFIVVPYCTIYRPGSPSCLFYDLCQKDQTTHEVKTRRFLFCIVIRNAAGIGSIHSACDNRAVA